MKKLKFILLVLTAASFFSLNAQRGNGLTLSRPTTEQSELYLENKPVRVNATPQSPAFVISNDKFMLSLGGMMKPIVGWDISNSLDDNILFNVANIPAPSQVGNRSDFFINPLHSILDLQVIALPKTDNQVVGYVKLEYNGPEGTARIHSLYVKYHGFLAGFNPSLFVDLATLPATISPEGVAGSDWSEGYQVNWTSPQYGGFFNFALGLEVPTYYDYTGKYKVANHVVNAEIGSGSQAIPDVTGYVQFKFNGEDHIRLTGLFRDIHYVDKTKNKGKDVIGWGTQFSTVASLGDYVKFMGQASYGKGIAAYISSMGYKPISFVPKEDDPGKLQASPMLGWFAGFKFLPSDDWSINLTYGTSRVWKVSHAYPDFKYGLDARISAFYKMTPWLQSGIEYLWGKHQTFDHKHGQVSRIQTVMMFTL